MTPGDNPFRGFFYGGGDAALARAKNMRRSDVNDMIGMHDQGYSAYVAGFVAICQTALP
jgi:hypothetical protein